MIVRSPRKRVRVALLGPDGTKSTLLSVYHASFICPVSSDVSFPDLSPDLLADLRMVRRLQKPASPPAKVAESSPRTLTFDWNDGNGGMEVEFVALPEKAMYPGDRVDSRRLMEWLRSEGFDVVIIVLNPHKQWSKLGRPAFQRVLLRYMALGRKAESSAYTLAEATTLAAEAVFGINAGAFNALNTGFDSLADSIKQLRFTHTHRSRDLQKVLEAEGADPDDLAEFMRVIDLIVQAACGETGELAITRDLLRLPHTILGLTHYDIGESSGLLKQDYEAFAEGLLPDDRARLRKDILFLRNVCVEMQPPPLQPVYLRDVRPEGGIDLWNATKPHLRAVAGRCPSSQPTPRPAAAAPQPVKVPEAAPAPVETVVPTSAHASAVVTNFAEFHLPKPLRLSPWNAFLSKVYGFPRVTLAAAGAIVLTLLAFAINPAAGFVMICLDWVALATSALIANRPTRHSEQAVIPDAIAQRTAQFEPQNGVPH